MKQDLEHLRWLSIGFFIHAGITGLFSLIPFVHLFLGIAMVSGSFENDRNPPPPFVGWLFIGIAAFTILSGFTLAITSFLAGKYIKEQKKYTYCFVMAIISCMFAPLGTILGVFAIIVLLRESVKQLFNRFPTSESFSSTGFNPPDWK